MTNYNEDKSTNQIKMLVNFRSSRPNQKQMRDELNIFLRIIGIDYQTNIRKWICEHDFVESVQFVQSIFLILFIVDTILFLKKLKPNRTFFQKL